MLAVGAPTFWMAPRAPGTQPRLRHAPLLAAALCFALGEAMALQWQAVIASPLATALLFLIALLAMRFAPRVALLPILALWAVAGCWCAQMQPSPAHPADSLRYTDGLSRMVRGRVLRVRQLPKPEDEGTSQQKSGAWESSAWETESGQTRLSIDLQLQQVEDVTPDTSTMRDTTDVVRVTVYSDAHDASAGSNATAPPLACGQPLEMPLRLRQPEIYRTPGAWSYAAQLESEGVSMIASVQEHPIESTGATVPSWRCRLFGAQNWAAGRLAAVAAAPLLQRIPVAVRFTAADAALLDAMILGDRTQLTHTLRNTFERTGSFHFFVVSGMHVALLAAFLTWLCRRVRLPQYVAVPLTLLLTAAYALFTGFTVPVQRALLMTAVYLLARWMLRSANASQALGAAALAVLVADPRALWSASFQMTFLVLFTIVGIAAPLIERLLGAWQRSVRDLDALWIDMRLHPREAQRRVMLRLFNESFAAAFGTWTRRVPEYAVRTLLRLMELCITGVLIEACMTLPMAVYFHRATLFALPSNLLLLPLVALLAPVAALTFAASLVSPWLAAIPAMATALLLHSVTFAVSKMSHAALADIRIPAPSTAFVIAALAALGAASWMLRRTPQGMSQLKSRIWLAAGVAALVLVPLAALWPEPPLLHAGVLEVTALDVGQGDSLLVVSPTGQTLLVDAGGPVGLPASTTRWDVGEEVVAPYLWSRRLRRLDAVLLTHAHSDHMGGMPAVLRDLHPRELWLSTEPEHSPDLQALLLEAHDLGITVRHFHAGDNFAWGGVTATVLAPEQGYENHGTPVNDDSLVMQLDFGKSSVLLEGDAERPSEEAMLAHARVHPVTLLKVGHHGSRTSTNPDFFAAAAPREAVISVGAHNTFGHPRPEVLGRLEGARVPAWRTDREGTVTFLLTPDGGISAQAVASNP